MITSPDAANPSPPSPPSPPIAEDRWKARFRAARMTMPDWALDRPARSLFACDASGTVELYTWDRDSGAITRVTDRPAGTHIGTLDPSGDFVWWFDDDAGNEFGIWRRQPFNATSGDGEQAASAVPAVAGLAASYPAGLALGPDGVAVVGRSTDDGTSIHLGRPDTQPVTIYAHTQDANVVALSRDGTLLAFEHSEHGDSRHMALRVVQLTSGVTAGDDVLSVGELWDGDGHGLQGIDFAPVAGDQRLLGLHELRGRWLPFVWDLATGVRTDLDLDLPGDVSARWFPDAAALLIRHDHHARSELFRFDLSTHELRSLGTPAGTVSGATARPDGSVEFLWSSGAQPPSVRNAAGDVVVRAPGAVAPASVPVTDAWVDGPGGRVHALISSPDAVTGPLPAVFLIHGGPSSHDADAFSPGVAAWVDAGFAVVRVNYRGSTGYGSAWRDAIEHRVGLTELDDIRAVRDWTVATGLVDPARIVLAGGSWGGYLTLLGLGVAPEAWTVGLAAVPVADYVAAYDDEMEGLRAFDRSLFGGTPETVPDRYRDSSPITYVDDVRAPVLVLAGANDPRCPIRQIENYLARLNARGAAYEVYRFDAGHGSLVVEERIRQMEAQLAFTARYINRDAQVAG